MGSLRFILAFLVLISHIWTSWGYFNPGMFALPSFYLISGYAMTAVLKSHYPGKKMVHWFYLDRVLRLYPQYVTFLIITVILIAILGIRDPFFSNRLPDSLYISPFEFFLNFLIIPNNLIFFRSHFSDIALLIPPAWSLGLEMMFYLIFPWILHYRLRNIVGIASFGIYVLAITSTINPMTWGYSLLPGNLFFFIIGSFLYEWSESGSRILVIATSITGSAGIIYLFLTDQLLTAANFESLAALLTGPVLIYFLKNFRHKADDFFGNISYGLFLAHYIIIHAIKTTNPDLSTVALILISSVFTILVASLGYLYIEKPSVQFRRKFRKY